MTREQAFKDINETQEFYINELINYLLDKSNDCFKVVNFTSDTGTGKTKMISLLCNKLPEKYFVITTLSKGQLQHQIRDSLNKDIKQDNFVVYGLQDFTANTKLQANEILAKLPKDRDIIWIRDEGHINTNRWQEIINNRCWKIINFSATNKEEGIRCNFAHTMMLRTVSQQEGTPEDALDKLLEVKKQHKKVKNYNPCAIVRALDKDIEDRVINACKERNLSYINITEESFDMSELCKDANEYDVIINKFKIVEGVDLRRAHVLYMTNEPSNPATTIQIIGRCRRNALLYRDDIDIFDSKNKKLLENTRKCFVYYNVQNMKIDTDENGNLCSAFCDKISCEQLKPNSTITVENGVMENGLTIIELEGETGEFKIDLDETTGFNIVNPSNDFYSTTISKSSNFIYKKWGWGSKTVFTKYNLEDIKSKLTLKSILIENKNFNYSTGEYETAIENMGLGYDVEELDGGVEINLTIEQVNSFIDYLQKFKFRVSSINGKKLKYYPSSIPANNKDLFDQENLIDVKSESLNKELFKLFYGGKNKAIEKVFENEEALKEFILFNSNNDRFSLPLGMNKNSPFTIKYRGKRKIEFLSMVQETNPNVYFEFYEDNSPPTRLYANDLSNIKHNSVTNFTLKELQKLKAYKYHSYTKVMNDKESAIIGVDKMRYFKDFGWAPDKAVTSKINKYCKFNSFIENKYQKQLKEINGYFYKGKNNFEFDKKCNSCLGYCAEYYGKYLIYGEDFLGSFIEQAKEESKAPIINDYIIIRACMLMYKHMMVQTFGKFIIRLIPTIGIEKLIQSKYHNFVNTVIELGKNVANFVKKEFNIQGVIKPEDKLYDPNLSIKHISGLADFINKEKIIDIKCTSSITIDHIKQVLAYHYLSTKRDDLDIEEVIVFDAVNNRSIRVKL